VPRQQCYVPEGGALVETCTRTIQGRLLLRPEEDANEILLGVLGRALDYYHVDLYGLAFLGSHYHLLIGAESALQMARFEGYLNGFLARKLGKHHQWQAKMWARRYRPMIISDEPEAQLARLKYVLAHGTKENLVESPYDWPGPNMAKAIVDGEPLIGYWFDESKEWAARRRGESFGKYDYAIRYEIEIQPLPAFRHLPPEEYREIVAGLITEIEEEAAAKRGDRPVVGVETILSANPHKPPQTAGSWRGPKRSPAPMLFYAKSKELLDGMKADYDDFVSHYRAAAESLLAAQEACDDFDPRSEFPQGCFPPALQFVGGVLLPPPPRPPTRVLEYDEDGRRVVARGPIPVVRVPRVARSASRSPPVVAVLESDERLPEWRCHDPPPIRSG